MPNARRQIFWLTDPELPKHVRTRNAQQSLRMACLSSGLTILFAGLVVVYGAPDTWFDYLRLALLAVYATLAVSYWVSYHNLKRFEARAPVDAD